MRQQTPQFRIGGPLTPMVKKLLIINGAVFILQFLATQFFPGVLEYWFGLHHEGLTHQFKVWQLFTYMFLHGNFFHILFNMIALWMFAGDLEMRWGSNYFIRYYVYSGIGAGIFIAIMNQLVYSQYAANPVTIGASGAIFALLLAYGMTWPNREVLLYFLFPVKMKYLVIVFGLIAFFGTLSSARGAPGNISHIGHLGGIISGLLLIYFRQKGPSTTSSSPKASKKKKDTGSFISRMMHSHKLKKKQNEIERRIKAKKIIDELLEKIARNGMSSLTSEERERLEWARKHYYPDYNDIVH